MGDANEERLVDRLVTYTIEVEGRVVMIEPGYRDARLRLRGLRPPRSGASRPLSPPGTTRTAPQVMGLPNREDHPRFRA
jgi:hypothetical protein